MFERDFTLRQQAQSAKSRHTMNRRNALLNESERSAQKYFTKSEAKAETAKDIAKKKRAFDAANTAKLRALRLAKEAADKEAADHLAAEAAKLNPVKRTVRKAVRPKTARIRMFY